jgi:hypothetical protein
VRDPCTKSAEAHQRHPARLGGLRFGGVRHGQLAVIPNIGNVIRTGKGRSTCQLPDQLDRMEQHSEDHPSSSVGQPPPTGPPAVAECRQRKNPIVNMIKISGSRPRPRDPSSADDVDFCPQADRLTKHLDARVRTARRPAEVDPGDGTVERVGYPHGTGRNGDAGGTAADTDWQAGVAKGAMFDVGWAIAGARRCGLRR